ncbi:MAG TPA: glycosyltransferase family 4 protein [Candidatus Acidoferrales bacterium]
MKVLQITRQFHPSTGGLESAVEGLSHAVKDAGHEVRILTLNKIFGTGESVPAESVVGGLNVSRIKHYGSRRFFIAPSVLKHINGSDLLHIHAVDFFVDFLGMSRRWHGRPIVLSTHGGFFHTRWLPWLKSAYFRTVTRQSMKHVGAVICVSEHDYEIFSTIVPKQQLHLVRNGVAVESYARVEKSITPGLLVGIGRVSPNKGIDRLIHAVAELRKTRPEVQLVWAGPDEANRIELLRNVAQEAGVADAVTFTGRVEVAELERLLAHANLFVSGSSYEGYGLSTIEAMSSGTVPVVTRVGIHPQLIRDGQNGFLVDNDTASLAQGLRQALDVKPAALAAMGQGAREVSEQCTWRHAVQAYLDIYKSVVTNFSRA